MCTKAFKNERGALLPVRYRGSSGRGEGGGVMGRQLCPPSQVSLHLKKVLPVLGNCREVFVLLHSTSESTVCFLGTS